MGSVKFNEQTYQLLLQDIFTRFPSVQTSAFDKAYKPGLEGIARFCEYLGNPQNNYSIIHVGGTNGKGSVSNLLASSLSAFGLKVGLYTSPHLVDFRERARIIEGNNLCLIPKEYVYNFILQHKCKFEELSLSFFEITTALAFQYFADIKVDIAVIEVGLGGRLDSTNIVHPILSVITSIGLDHCEYLGYSLAKIAEEKAGIIKPYVPVVIGEVLQDTMPVFKAEAKYNKAKIYIAEDALTEDETVFLNNVFANMDLRGEYQIKNLRTAFTCLKVLGLKTEQLNNSAYSNQNTNIDCHLYTNLQSQYYINIGAKEYITQGNNLYNALINTAKIMGFRGRWERLGLAPLTICDIGHNAHALKHNFSQLLNMVQQGEVSSLVIVYGVMADKNLDEILPLMPLCATYIFTQPSTPRALSCNVLAQKFKAYLQTINREDVAFYIVPNVKQAYMFAKQLVNTNDINNKPLIYIGGSNFVVSEVVE